MKSAKKSKPPTSGAPTAEDEKLAQFSRAASHELGNVLGTIAGELDYGLTNTNTLVRYRAMNVALAAAERAISLARNLSYFVVHPQMDLRPQDISQLVIDTVEIVEKDLRNRHIKFSVLVEASRVLQIDAGAMQQVLLNLFRRASETMPQGGQLTVSLRQNGNKVEIACTDTGVGIPAAQVDEIFQPDYLRVTQNGMQVRGLELAVAKTLIERQGGELKIHSREGQGTTYTLLFPYNPDTIRPPSYAEHRRFRRVKACLPVEVSFDGQNPFMSEIQSLSVRGCYIGLVDASARLPAVDSMGALRVYYYQDQVLDVAKCRIANQVRNAGRNGVGIEFLELDSRARKLLEAIVKSHSF